MNKSCIDTILKSDISQEIKDKFVEDLRNLIINAYNAGYEDMECFHINDANQYAEQVLYLNRPE